MEIEKANSTEIEKRCPDLLQFLKEQAPGLNAVDRLLRQKGRDYLLNLISEEDIKKFLPEGMQELARKTIENPRLYGFVSLVIPLNTDQPAYLLLSYSPQDLKPEELVDRGHHLDRYPPHTCTHGTSVLIGDRENDRLVGILTLDSGTRTWDSFDSFAKRNFLELFKKWLFEGSIVPVSLKAKEEIPNYKERVFVLMEDGFSPRQVQSVSKL